MLAKLTGKRKKKHQKLNTPTEKILIFNEVWAGAKIPIIVPIDVVIFDIPD